VGIEGLEIMQHTVYQEIERFLTGVNLLPPKILAGLRVVKSDWEIKMLENAAKVNDLAMSAGINALKEGMTEWDLAAIIDNFFRNEGCTCTVPTLIGIGPNTAEDGAEVGKPSWETRANRKLEQCDCLWIDLAGVVP